MTTGFTYGDVVELSRFSREEVCAAYHGPQPVLGMMDKTIKSTLEELREQFPRESSAPTALKSPTRSTPS